MEIIHTHVHVFIIKGMNIVRRNRHNKHNTVHIQTGLRRLYLGMEGIVLNFFDANENLQLTYSNPMFYITPMPTLMHANTSFKTWTSISS